MNPYAELTDEQILAQCRVETLRGSGPGGQHRNKVESAVRLLHLPTGLRSGASERRSQHMNLALAVKRLREKIAKHFHRDAPRIKTRKTRGVRNREQESRRRQARKKELRRPPDD